MFFFKFANVSIQTYAAACTVASRYWHQICSLDTHWKVYATNVIAQVVEQTPREILVSTSPDPSKSTHCQKVLALLPH